MPGSQTRKNRPKGYELIAQMRHNLARQQKFQAKRMARKLTARNIEKSKKILAAATRAIQKATRNATMRNAGPRGRGRRGANNTNMATRRSARVAAQSIQAAQKKAARTAATAAARMNKDIESELRRLNALSAERKRKVAKEAANKLAAEQNAAFENLAGRASRALNLGPRANIGSSYLKNLRSKYAKYGMRS